MRNQYLSRPDLKEYLKQFQDITSEEKAELLIPASASLTRESTCMNERQEAGLVGRPIQNV